MATFSHWVYFHSDYFGFLDFPKKNILATFKTLTTQPTRVWGTAHVAVATKLNPIVVESSEVRSIIFHHLFIIFQKRIFHHAPPYHRAPLWAFFPSVLIPATGYTLPAVPRIRPALANFSSGLKSAWISSNCIAPQRNSTWTVTFSKWYS